LAVYTQFFPGPSSTEEYFSLTAMRDSIGSNIFLRLDGSPGGGAPAGTWIHQAWNFTGGATPRVRWEAVGSDAAAGHTYRAEFRFSTLLLGTLDPSLWFNGTDDPLLGKMDSLGVQDVVSKYGTARVASFYQGLLPNAVNAGLSTGTPISAFSAQTVTDGPNAGLVYAAKGEHYYDPTTPEFNLGFQQLFYQQTYIAEAPLAGVNISTGQTGIGTAVDATPVVQIQGGSQTTSWNTFTQSIQTNLWQSNTAVTNIGDLGGPTPVANEPTIGDVKIEVFANPGALVAYEAGTGALSGLTTVAGAVLATLAGVYGAVSAFLTNIGSWLGALAEVESCLPSLVTEAAHLQQLSTIASESTRIADALECICAQLQASAPPDGTTIHDQLKETREALDAVATTRAEIELQAKGIRVVATGGVIEEAP